MSKFKNWKDDDIQKREKEIDEQIEKKLFNMKYDEELQELYKESEEIYIERKKRGLSLNKDGETN